MGEILTTIIAILTVVGFMSAQIVMMIRGQERLRKEFKEEFKEARAEFRAEFKEVRGDIAAVDERQSAEIKEVRGDIAAVNERLSAEIAAVNERLSAEIAGVNERLSAEIAAINERLSHTDGLVEGLSRALLSTQAPAQAQALPQTQAQA